MDVAYLDATFYSGAELPGRDLSKIPHPWVIKSMERFKSLPERERAKVRFIHLNHSNPLLLENSKENATVIEKGFNVAKQGETIKL